MSLIRELDGIGVERTNTSYEILLILGSLDDLTRTSLALIKAQLTEEQRTVVQQMQKMKPVNQWSSLSESDFLNLIRDAIIASEKVKKQDRPTTVDPVIPVPYAETS